MVTVRVPATTANLGPGFDTLGLALARYNTLTFEEVPEGLFFDGVEPEYATEENLAVIAYKAVLSKLGLPMSGLRVSGANANHGSPLSREELLAVCNAIEGHPDNLAPAIFGGLVASFVENGRPYIARYSLHRSLRCTALIPDFQLSTHLARSVLPEKVPYFDAIYNVSRTAVLLKALENGDTETISAALRDRLHQPFRRTLIAGFDEAEQLANDCGCVAFFISGAGPTLLCLSAAPAFAARLAETLELDGSDI